MRTDRAGRLVLDALDTAVPDLDDLARRTGLARAVVADRYHRLMEGGAVRMRADVHPACSDRPATAMVWGRPGVGTDDDALDALASDEAVEDVLVLAGEAAVAYRVRAATLEDAAQHANDLAQQAGFELWTTAAVLRRVGERAIMA